MEDKILTEITFKDVFKALKESDWELRKMILLLLFVKYWSHIIIGLWWLVCLIGGIKYLS